MKVIILVGGFGTRLQSVVKDVPKPMADINGSPFLDLLMQKLVQEGVTEFVLCVSYLKESIIEYFGKSFYGIPVNYSMEDEPLGTGGAIKQAFTQFAIEEALILNGDTYLDMSYQDFYTEHKDSQLALVLQHVEDTSRYGKVLFSDAQITAFEEKGKDVSSGFINAGIYKVHKDIFAQDCIATMPLKFSFENVLQKQVQQLQAQYYLAKAPEGVGNEPYFIDIGLPKSYHYACETLHSIVKARKNKALFLDRDGVINVDTHHMYKIEDCVFIDGIFEKCRKAKADGYKIIVITNQAGIGKGLYTEEDYFTLRSYIHGVFAQEGCPIDGEYYCPYHVDGLGKYKKDSYDRKPNPGMLLKAVKDFDIDIKKSIFIGDKESDMEAGRWAGILEKNLKKT